jgi:hypothetical protein
MVEDIASHIVNARTINWEMEYGATTCNLETGVSAATPDTDDEGDPICAVGVHKPPQSRYSLCRQGNNSFCFPISPNEREVMDIPYEMYQKKGGDQADPQVLMNSMGNVSLDGLYLS